jgi:hypothetical protein
MFGLSGILNAQIPTNGLMAYFPFNGNSNDESGTGNNGTVYGATLTTDRFGNPNSAYSFNGIDNYIEVPHNATLAPTTQMTLSVWVKPHGYYFGNYGGNYILSKGNDTNEGWYELGYATSTQKFIYSSRYSGGSVSQNISSSQITLDTWYNIVGCYDGSKMIIFVNGVAEDTVYVTSALAINTESLFIGRHLQNTNPYWVNADIDDIRIYNTALNNNEITALFNENQTSNCLISSYPFCGNANDVSGNSNNGTVIGATLTTDRFNNVDSAYNFNGTDQYIQVLNNPTFNNLTNFSFSTWIYWQNSTWPYDYVFKKGNYNNYAPFQLSANADSTCSFWVHSSSNNATATSTDKLQINTWYNVTGVYDGLDLKLYINSIEVATAPFSDTLLNNNQDLFIGCDGGVQGFFKGKIDDVHFFKCALSQTEIDSLYNEGGCPAPVPQTYNSSVCYGQTTSITASGGTTYKWYDAATNGNLLFSGATYTTPNLTSNTAYYVANDNGTCESARDTVNVIINQLPVVSITALPALVNFNSAPVALTGNPSGGIFNGNGVNGTYFNPTIAGLGTQVVSYNYTDINSCSNSAFASTVVYDTTGVLCTSYDTVYTYISVTDTLIVDVLLTGVNPPSNTNTIKVYPNPANDYVMINAGNYSLMTNYKISIENTLGQVVFETFVTQQVYQIDVNPFGGLGTYFIKIIDNNSTVIDTRKIIFQ